MNEQEDIQEWIADTAYDLVQAEPDPEKWVGWLIYLVERLECETTKTGVQHPEAIELAFERLKDALVERLKSGRW